MIDTEDDQVGYKKPPKKTQFQKGQSGNPKGRPPIKCFHLTFIDLLNEGIAITFNGEKVTIPFKEALLRKVLIDATNGKQTATKNVIEILKHLTNLPVI